MRNIDISLTLEEIILEAAKRCRTRAGFLVETGGKVRSEADNILSVENQLKDGGHTWIKQKIPSGYLFNISWGKEDEGEPT